MDTKFFNRKKSGGMFSIIDRQHFPTGDIWWVDSTNASASDTAGYGGNPDAPFATWAYAQGTAAAAGDTIFLMPGHAETIGVTAAAALTFALAGIRNVGLGGQTLKPQILIDGFADTYVSVTAADVTFENIAFSSGHADVAQGFLVAAAGVEFRGCQFLENTASENFLVSIQTTAAADDLVIDNCMFYGVTQATECIELVGANDRVQITNNLISGLYSVSAISASTTACLGIQIHNNRIFNGTTAGNDLAGAVDLFTASTGMVTSNLIYLGDDTDCLTSIDADGCGRAGNFAANEYDQEGGVAATQSA